MALKAGLVGLPNVGKSTIFNALTKSSVPAENYPFCTINPHLAITNVPDERIEKLTKIFGSQKVVPATVQFVDIAGLVKGAAQGEGLGNQFLSHIMDVDLIFHVVRCFEDDKITHVAGSVDPISDFEVIITELMLKDLESVTKREEKLSGLLKSAKMKNIHPQQILSWEQEHVWLQEVKKGLEKGDLDIVQAAAKRARQDNLEVPLLLTGKNFLVLANFSEDEYVGDGYKQSKYYHVLNKHFGAERVIPVSAKIEGELAQLDEKDAAEMMESLGITHRGLDTIITQAYRYLGLETFFTCGPKEIHAWSIKAGTNVVAAAGEIHSDLARGFICAEVYNCADLFAVGSEQQLKSTGKLRTEGKGYVVRDGDVMHVKFNV